MHKVLNAIYFILFFIITSLSNAAYADPTTFNFMGTVTYTYGPIGLPNPLVGTFYVGQKFNGSFSFDSDATGTLWPGDVNNFVYSNAISNYSINFGNLYADFNNGGLSVANDRPNYEVPPEEGGVPTSFEDIFGAGASIEVTTSRPANVNTNISIPNYHVKELSMSFYDNTAIMMNSTDLPVMPPNIANVSSQLFTMDFGLNTGTAEATITGKINSLTLAPEPISSILFVTGGTLLAGRRLLRSAKERKCRRTERKDRAYRITT